MSTQEVCSHEFTECQFTLDPNRCTGNTPAEKLTAAVYLRKLTQETDHALATLKHQNVILVPLVPKLVIESLKENGAHNSILQKVASCISKTTISSPNDPNIKTRLGQFIENVTTNLAEFRTSITSAYSALALTELPHWGNCFQDKPSTLVPDSISQAQDEVLNMLKQYSPIKHEEDTFDVDPRDPDLEKLSAITTGVCRSGKPFIIIKAQVKCNLVPGTTAEKSIGFRGKYRDDYGNLCETPYWRVLNCTDYFNVRIMTHEEFLATLQRFFAEGLTCKYNNVEWHITFPNPVDSKTKI